MKNKTKKQRKTVVRGLRASQTFWERCDKVAESENMTRNEFILFVVNEYLSKKDEDNKVGKL